MNGIAYYRSTFLRCHGGRLVDWEGEAKTREDLLLAKMWQLDERMLMESRAVGELERSRKGNKAYFDQYKRMRGDTQQLCVGDLVLILQSKNLNSHAIKIKLDDRWFGPYGICEIPPDSTLYKLEELDGMHLKATFAGDRLKRFFSCFVLDEDHIERHEVIQVWDGLEESKDTMLAVGDTEEDLGVQWDELE